MSEDQKKNTVSGDTKASDNQTPHSAKNTSAKASPAPKTPKKSSASKQGDRPKQDDEDKSSKLSASMGQAGHKIAETLRTAQEHLKDDADQANKVITKEDSKLFVLILYGLCITGFITLGILGVAVMAGLALTFLKKKTSEDHWADTHISFLRQTFAFGLAVFVLGMLLCMTGVGCVIGFPLMLAVSVWAVARSLAGFLWALKEKPYPNPGTWLI